MKRYIAVLEIEDDEEIIDASVSYSYSYNGMNYKATERMKLKAEDEEQQMKTDKKIIFTDNEYRIFLSAMSREEKICKKLDEEMKGEDTVDLVPICKSIERKIKLAMKES